MTAAGKVVVGWPWVGWSGEPTAAGQVACQGESCVCTCSPPHQHIQRSAAHLPRPVACRPRCRPQAPPLWHRWRCRRRCRLSRRCLRSPAAPVQAAPGRQGWAAAAEERGKAAARDRVAGVLVKAMGVQAMGVQGRAEARARAEGQARGLVQAKVKEGVTVVEMLLGRAAEQLQQVAPPAAPRQQPEERQRQARGRGMLRCPAGWGGCWLPAVRSRVRAGSRPGRKGSRRPAAAQRVTAAAVLWQTLLNGVCRHGAAHSPGRRTLPCLLLAGR